MSISTAEAAPRSKASVVRMTNRYPKHESESDAPRPYRIWDEKEQAVVPHRFYRSPKKAHEGAILECRWIEIGGVLTVYDASNGKALGQYKHRINGIDFIRLLRVDDEQVAE